jgi:hypothetical protein
MVELRQRGWLLGFHADEAAARTHLAAHYADHEDQASFTIEPRRPVSLYCRGTLVDTCHSLDDAADAMMRRATKRAPIDVWSAVPTEPLG